MIALLAVVAWRTLGDAPRAPGAAPDLTQPPVSKRRSPTPRRPPSLAGTLVDRSTGAPIHGGTVRAACSAVDRVVTAGRDGGFSIDGLPAGPCELSWDAPGYVAAGPNPRAGKTVAIDDARPTTGLRLGLYAAATLTGRVLADGRPAPGVALSVLFLEAPGHSGAFSIAVEAPTDSDGHFELTRLGPGRVRVLAEHEDYGLAESEDRFLTPGVAAQALEIRLVSTGSIRGVVVDQAGAGVAGATVHARHESGTLRAWTATSTRDGNFEIATVSAGDVRVVATAHGLQQAAPAEVTVAPDDITRVRLELHARPGFGGTVVDPEGRPISGAAVYVLPRDTEGEPSSSAAHTSEHGLFWIDEPPSPPAVAFARHPGFGRSERVGVGGSERDLVLMLTRGGRLTGLVVNTDGQALPSYRLTIRPSGGTTTVSVPDPRFTTRSLEPGRYSVRVESSSGPAAESGRFEVRAGGVTDVGTIVVGPGGAVLGRVVHADTAEPVRGARIQHDAGPPTHTRSDGSFRLDGVAARPSSLWIKRRGYVPRLVTGVSPPEGGEIDLGALPLTPTTGEENRIQYSGVGIQVGVRPDRLILNRIFPGGPAANAGLEEGTAVLAINGFQVVDLTARQAIEMIRGESGTEVTLEILGAAGVETIRIERGDVDTGR